MKHLYLLLLLFATNTSFAQNYPAFKFTTIKSQWDYFSIDTNFVKDNINPQVTKYSSIYGSEFLKSKDKLLILQNSSSPNQFIEENGYLLHQIDIKTGKVGWILHNNTYNKKYKFSKYGQTPVIDMSFINNQDQVVVLSNVSKDTIRSNSFGPLYFNTNYARAVFNINDGTEISTIIGTSKTKNKIDCTRCLKQLYVRGMDDYCQLSYNYLLKNKITYERADFYSLTKEMDLDTSNVLSLEFSTDIFSAQPIGEYADFYSQLNNDTVMLLNSIVNIENLEYSPKAATLRWIDISNRNDISEVHTLDLKPYYILPDANFYKERPTVSTLDNNILVAQRIFADRANPFKGEYWVLWLDAKGNTRASVRSLRVGDRVYELLHPYTIKGDRCYLLGEYYEGNEGGIDLVEITAGTNDVRKTANLITYPRLNKTRRIAADAAIWIDEEHSAFGFRMYKDTTVLQSEYFYYIGVRNADLGIISSTKEVDRSTDIMFYPNPASDVVTITFVAPYTGTLTIRDIHNQTVGTPIQLWDADRYDLRVADLPTGTYYIILDDGRGHEQVVGRPVVKI